MVGGWGRLPFWQVGLFCSFCGDGWVGALWRGFGFRRGGGSAPAESIGADRALACSFVHMPAGNGRWLGCALAECIGGEGTSWDILGHFLVGLRVRNLASFCAGARGCGAAIEVLG